MEICQEGMSNITPQFSHLPKAPSTHPWQSHYKMESLYLKLNAKEIRKLEEYLNQSKKEFVSWEINSPKPDKC